MSQDLRGQSPLAIRVPTPPPSPPLAPTAVRPRLENDDNNGNLQPPWRLENHNIRHHSRLEGKPEIESVATLSPHSSLVRPPTPPFMRVRAITPSTPRSNQTYEHSQTTQTNPEDPLPLTYKHVESFLDTQYNSDNSNKSVICDIIAMYLKGQKILYTEAKTVCEQRMNYLMLPAIFITSLCTILSLVLKDQSYGPTIVSSFNGFNAFLLAVISYLKLDAKAEAHRTSAYKFDKLQSELEFSSGKSLFTTMTYENMMTIINNTETNVKDIKETNKFILPEDIRMQYPKLCNMNVFAEVKRVQNTEMALTNRLKDVMKQLLDPTLTPSRKEELKMLESSLTQDIIALKDDYLLIDDLFEEEMRDQRERLGRSCQPFGWLKT